MLEIMLEKEMRNISQHFVLRKFNGLQVIFCLLIVTFVAACEPSTNVKGIVKDKSGAALADVSVTMFSSANDSAAGEKKKESEQKTDEHGKFNFVTLTPGAKKVILVFTKQGFRTVEKEIPANITNELNVVLEPAAE